MARGPDHFVVLATLGDAASAHLWAARLESEGIETKVHGDGLGPYPVTVGGLAATQIWVLESRIDEARHVMLAAEVDQVMEVGSSDGEPGRPAVRLVALVLAVVLVIVVARAVLWLF